MILKILHKALGMKLMEEKEKIRKNIRMLNFSRVNNV